MTEKFASSKFSDFTNVQELYRSQAGAVFRALFKYDNKEYVLKERKLPKLGNTKDIMNEVKLLAQLDHSNVIRCEGWFRDEGRQSIFIVLEFCSGGDLNGVIVKRRAERKYFEEAQIWEIFYQLCNGLKHLHEHGIIHRDLKPLNVFCSNSGHTYKIGDLGVSRQVSEDTMMLKSFYGTPLYLSPELVDNKPYNEKTDIWSLGVILYELCALQPPFKGNTLLDVAKLVSHGKYAPLPSHYSPHVSKCVAWMLNLDFSKRPNVAQLLAFVQARLPVVEQRSRHTKQKGRKSKAKTVAVPMQTEEGLDTGGEGEHSDDTRDTAMDDDSLEGGSPARANKHKHKHDASGKEKRWAGLAGKAEVHSDTDSDGTQPDWEQEEQQKPYKHRPHANIDAVAAKKPEYKTELPYNKYKQEHHQPPSAPASSAVPMSVPAASLEVPAPRRQNIRELRMERNMSAPAGDMSEPPHAADRPEHHNRAKEQKQQRPVQQKQNHQKSYSAAVTVQADCQRMQVLLRRELTTLRKLLQVRDFVALKPNGENDTDLLDDDQSGSRDQHGATIEVGVVDRIKMTQINVLVLETALNNNGIISEADAIRYMSVKLIVPFLRTLIHVIIIRFKLISKHSRAEEAGAARCEHVSSKVAVKEETSRRPVTELPHRPGEPAVLGLDINVDRAGHSRHLVDPHYYPSEPGAHLDRVGRPTTSHQRDSHGQSAPALRKSPERKQVPPQSSQMLLYDDEIPGNAIHSQGQDYKSKREKMARNPPPATAAASEIGEHSHSPQALHQPLIANKQALFQEELVRPVHVPERRPSTASSAQRRQAAAQTVAAPPKQPIPAPVVEEYRIFEQRGDRLRPGTAGVPRSSSAATAAVKAPPPDDNGARKERLLAMWDNQQNLQLNAHGGLGLPSMRGDDNRKPRGARPKSAMCRVLEGHTSAAVTDHFAGAALKRVDVPEPASAKGKERDLAQYEDIMHSCRAISDKQRNPVHRRQKSDVTNHNYVLPPPPSSSPNRGGERVVVPVKGVPPAASQYQQECDDAGNGGPRRKRVSLGEAHVLTYRQPQVDNNADPYDSADAGEGDGEWEAFDPISLQKQQHRGNGDGRQVKEIRLRGAGRSADGETLHVQARFNKDTAYKIICGT